MPPVASATATITSCPRATWARTWPRSTSGASAPISASVRGASDDSRLDEMPTHGQHVAEHDGDDEDDGADGGHRQPADAAGGADHDHRRAHDGAGREHEAVAGERSAPSRPTTATAAPAYSSPSPHNGASGCTANPATAA